MFFNVFSESPPFLKAELITSVSYTHLDVYKRQGQFAELTRRAVIQVAEVPQTLLHERDFIATVVLWYDVIRRHAKRGREHKQAKQ